MSRKKQVQLVSIAFLVVGIILLIPGTNWHDSNSELAFLSVLFGTGGSVISIFIPSNYVYPYTDSDWIALGEERYRLSIPASKHGQGSSPSIQHYMLIDGRYSLCLGSADCDDKGNILIDLPEQDYKSGKIVIS